MYIGLNVKCQILMKLQISGQIFRKILKIKFNENRGSRVIP